MAIKAQLAPRKKLRAKIAGAVFKSETRMQSKVVTPNASIQTVKPDPGYNGLSFVTVMGASLERKTVDPSTKTYTYTPGVGYTGFESVTVNAMPDAESMAFSSAQIDPDELYAIGYNWFAQVVGHIQTMAGTKQNMTPAKMLYWLGRVKYIPQSNAESSFSLEFDSGATGTLPDYQVGTATSAFSMSFDSSASGN